MRSPDRDFLGVLLIPLLGLACCVGLPLLLSAGAGAAVWILGAGAPIAVAVVIGGVIVQRWRHRRAAAAREEVRRSVSGSGRPSASEPLRRSTPATPEGDLRR